MAKTKILFISQEMSPFLDLTNISKITRQLPQTMQENGCEIRILMPRFGNINERRNRLHEVIRLSGMNIVINENDNPLIIKVASIPTARMQVYFLDNEEYFHRKYVFTDAKGKFYNDNDERTIFFCKGAIETVKKLGWNPDIVHCHGWMSSLVPMYLKTTYKNDPVYKNAKIVYSVYENDFTEKMSEDFDTKALITDMQASETTMLKSATNSDLHKAAIQYADAVVKGSENIDPIVEEFLKNQQKPTLDFQSPEDYKSFSTFYDELLQEELIAAEA